MKKIDVDVLIEDHGSVSFLQPLTCVACDWVGKNIGPDNGFQPFWPTAIVQRRYAANIAESMRNAGLIVMSLTNPAS